MASGQSDGKPPYCPCLIFFLSQRLVKHVVHLVPAKLLAELLIVGILIDDASLHIGNLRKVAPVLIGKSEAET